ncbi:MAG TPA: RloB family protein [Candidatus Sumerlaeota bacterium]|nr:RloB family protein [Candidatus Sumerlaeota bacterium]
MIPPQSRERKGPHFRREKPLNLKSGKKFLIVTEGEKTEPNYFKKLRKYLGLRTNVEVVHPDATDPITLVNEAKELRAKREREAKKRPDRVEYDEVWVVFDLEKIHDERRRLAGEAIEKARNSAIRVAYSDPSFEYWLILHEKYTAAPLQDGDESIKRLKEYWPEYEKNQEFPEKFIKKYPTATQNAERVRQYHEESGNDGMNRNPYTEVDCLVQSLTK